MRMADLSSVAIPYPSVQAVFSARGTYFRDIGLRGVFTVNSYHPVPHETAVQFTPRFPR